MVDPVLDHQTNPVAVVYNCKQCHSCHLKGLISAVMYFAQPSGCLVSLPWTQTLQGIPPNVKYYPLKPLTQLWD